MRALKRSALSNRPTVIGRGGDQRFKDRLNALDETSITERRSCMFLLGKMLNELHRTDDTVPPLPRGGSLLEIGGPSYGMTLMDIALVEPESYVAANLSEDVVGQQNVTQKAVSFREALQEKSYQAIFENPPNASRVSVPAEEVSSLVPEYGKFDYVTAYGVFGPESRDVGHDPAMGADLSTPEQRLHILDELAGVMKPGALLALRTIPPQYVGQHGFDNEELEAKGFTVLTEHPVPGNGDMMLFQYLPGSPDSNTE